jgi:hypothetical protein
MSPLRPALTGEEAAARLFLLVFGGTGLCACKAGTLLLEPHLQSILFWFF